MSEPEHQTCPFCEKQGLALLPLRVAVARGDTSSTVLDLPGGFKTDGVDAIEVPGNCAQYTSRLLRTGYLYVFNEVRGDWKGYVVTEKGFLYEFDPDEQASPPDADKIEFSCYRTGEEYIARCITIPNAQNAGKVWLGFSDTAWTQDVLEQNRSQAYREKHMRVVNVKDWVSGQTAQPGTVEFEQLTSVVNEFTYEGAQPGRNGSGSNKKQSGDAITVYGYQAFGFSPYEFHGIEHEAKGLREWGDQAEQAPMMVSVPDPVGITAELAALMSTMQEEFLQQDELRRPLAISALIDSLQESIRNNAELDLIRRNKAAGEKIADDYIASGGLYWAMKGDEAAERRHAEMIENMEERNYNLTADDLKSAADSAWDDYKDQLTPDAIKNWRTDVLEPKRDEYDQNYIIPLANAHQAWFKSDPCKHSFQCNHDPRDGDSGVGYIQALLFCIQDSQQIKICADNYEQALAGEATDEGNLILRGFVHNQQPVAEALGNAESSAGPDLSSVPWDSLIKVYRESLKHVDKGGKNIVAQLITALGGPLVKTLNTGVDQTAGRLLVKLGVIAESSVEKLTHVGTLDDALDAFVVWMKRANPEALDKVDASLLKQRLEIQSRGKRANTRTRGADGQFKAGKTELRFDRYALSQLEDELSSADLAKRAAGATLSMTEMPRSGLSRFRTMFDTQSRLAVIGLLFEMVGLLNMSKEMDEKTTLANRVTENEWKFRSAALSFWGGVGELLHDWTVGIAKATGRLSKTASSIWLKYLGGFGKALGIAGAVIIVAWDAYNAYKEAQKGNVAMTGLYLGSVGSNLGALFLFSGGGAWLGITSAALATGIGVILVLLGMAIAVAISYFHTNELQEWMARCEFGNNEAERYDGLEKSMEQFKIAMESMGNGSDDDEAASDVPEGAHA